MDYLAKLLPPLPDHETPVKALTFLHPGAKPAFTYSKIGSPIKQNEVLVKVTYAALNPCDNKIAGTPAFWAYPGEKGLGRDFCGVIDEVGKAVTDFKVGDRVCGMVFRPGGKGTIASHIVVNVKSDAIVKAPANLSDEEAAAFPLAYGTAWQALHRAKLDEHSWVCILGGSSSTGMFAIQLAKSLFGVARVIATCSASSAELVQSLGADEIINYKAEDVVETLLEIVGETKPKETSTRFAGHERTTHEKFNLIMDCVGGSEVVSRWRSLLKPKSAGSAYVTLVGDPQADENSLGGAMAYTYSPSMVGRSLFGGFMGLNYYVEAVRADGGEWIAKAPEIFEANKAKVIIDKVYPWAEWEEAMQKQAAKKAHGKLVLKVEEF
ncbi:protein Ast1p [Trichomonascus vanleenenianus]|uniref:protein Ast1p n=1 Tax=Trichomonascus vanleenenianus TaxID=2268995 RepID=UPI003ECB3DAA